MPARNLPKAQVPCVLLMGGCMLEAMPCNAASADTFEITNSAAGRIQTTSRCNEPQDVCKALHTHKFQQKSACVGPTLHNRAAAHHHLHIKLSAMPAAHTELI